MLFRSVDTFAADTAKAINDLVPLLDEMPIEKLEKIAITKQITEVVA